MTFLLRSNLLLHTLRYLRPRQIAGRAWHRLHSPHVRFLSAPPARSPTAQWITSIERDPFQHGPDQFMLLNEDGRLSGPEAWNNPAYSKLWLYHLHYFDDLNAWEADGRTSWHQALIARWIAENPVGHGNGWEPYPLSLRIVNWVKWSLCGHELQTEWLDCLAMQVRYLHKSLEYHLLGNHLLANAKALVFAGLYFSGDEADGWLERGMAILRKELAEQVLDDGGHFERSPMYHAIIYEDVLDLINLSRVSASVVEPESVAQWKNLAQRMGQWLQVMSHPDGEIGFFNDAAMRMAPRPGDLYAYMERLDLALKPPPGYFLQSSGHVRLENDAAVALLDVAPIGPDYLPGHAHADTLSFELSLFGQRVLVNSGVSHYHYDPERLRQRGTAAHNTVEINGENSSEVWHAFRVARRARPFGLDVSESRVVCSHDGYKRLKGCPVHRRTWELAENGFEIRDVINGSFEQAIAYFHVHPDVGIRVNEDGRTGQLIVCDDRAVRFEASGGMLTLHPSTWHPEFGLSLSSQALRLQLTGAKVVFQLSWA